MRSRDSGEKEEQRRFYRVHVRAVYAFFAYSVDRTTAEDLTSATFERALRAWSTFDAARASERTWILAIARNLLTDHFRRERHRAGPSVDEHPALLERMVTTDDPLARELSTEGLVSWLRHLNQREREVLALRFGADLSAREVSELTGLSEANVHQVSSRALGRLRERLEVTDTGPPRPS